MPAASRRVSVGSVSVSVLVSVSFLLMVALYVGSVRVVGRGTVNWAVGGEIALTSDSGGFLCGLEPIGGSSDDLLFVVLKPAVDVLVVLDDGHCGHCVGTR